MDTKVIMKSPVLPKGRLWVALAAILLGQFVVSIDLTVLNIALPEITRELKPTSDQLLWTVDIYSLVLAGLLIAVSSLSDRIGRKATLLTGFLIFGVGSVLVLFVNDPAQLIAIRGLLGIGGAAIMPITISMIRSIFLDAKERSIAVAAWSAVSAIGMAAGPLIGGVLLEHFNWHAAFLVNVPLVAAAFALGVFSLPEIRVKDSGCFDVLGSLLALTGMVALLWGIKHVAAELAFDTSGTAAIVGGVLLLAVFARRCLKAKDPIVDLSLFRSKTFTAGVIATLACTFALAVLLYLIAQWLQLVNGDGTLESGIKLIPMSAATLVSSLAAAALAMRYQARNVVAAGLALAASAMIMLFFFSEDLTVGPVIASTCLVGLGTGSLAIGASLIMAETPVEKASSAGSLQEISYDLGNVLGVAILGSLASVIYRAELGKGVLRAMGLDGAAIDAARQSFAGAIEVAHAYGLPELIKRGAEAFDQSLAVTCLAGGIVILIAAIVVWRLIPKGLKVTDEQAGEDGPPTSAAVSSGLAASVQPYDAASEREGDCVGVRRRQLADDGSGTMLSTQTPIKGVSMDRLKDKVAIVTGSTSGIGKGIAKMFAAEGAKVVVCGRREERGQAIVDEIEAVGGTALYHFLDITKPETIDALLADTETVWGKVDVMVNNAAGMALKDGRVDEISLEDWDAVFASDIRSTFYCTKTALPYLQKNGGGSIINIGSMAVCGGDLSTTAYACAKAGVDMLTQYTALQYGKQNIRCNCVRPGLIVTDENADKVPDMLKNIFLDNIEVARYGSPEDIAAMCVYLASDESGYFTGQVVTVDGGLNAHVPTVAQFRAMASRTW